MTNKVRETEETRKFISEIMKAMGKYFASVMLDDYLKAIGQTTNDHKS